MFNIVYKNTPESDRLRKLFVDMFARDPNVSPQVFFEPADKGMYTHDFLFDLGAAMVERDNKKKPDLTNELLTKNLCEWYHDHTDINAPREPKPLTNIHRQQLHNQERVDCLNAELLGEFAGIRDENISYSC